MKKLNNKALLKRIKNRKDIKELFPEEVIENMYLCKAFSNEEIIRQGNKLDKIYYLLEGRISVHTYLDNGKKIILTNRNAPSLIGEVELLDNKNAVLSVKALEDLLLICIDLKDNRDILLNDNRFLRKICSLISNKEITSSKRLIHTFGFPLENRLADFILRNSIDDYYSLKKSEAAESLGVSYRHLSKVMADFVNKKYLKKNKLVYKIINKNLLNKLASVINE